MTINHVSPFTVTIKKPNVSSNLTEFNSGGIAISLWEMLRTSQFYNNYQPMFDQVRIEKCRVKATGSAASTGLTGFSSPTVTMAFDRNGLDDSQVENSVTNDQGACVLLSPKLISTYSSSQIKQWSSGNSFVMYQTIMPSTVVEKGQYLPTGSLLEVKDDNAGVTSNPCNVYTDSGIPFKPVCLLTVTSPFVASDSDMTFSFTIEFEFVVTFRGMRKPAQGLALSSNKLVPLVDTIHKDGMYIKLPSEINPDAEGFSSVTLNVEVDPVEDVQNEKSVSITQNNTNITIEPDEGYDSMSRVLANVKVPFNTTDLTVSVNDTAQQVFEASSGGYDGFKKVVVNVGTSLVKLPMLVNCVIMHPSSVVVSVSQFVRVAGSSWSVTSGTYCVVAQKVQYRSTECLRFCGFVNTGSATYNVNLGTGNLVAISEPYVYSGRIESGQVQTDFAMGYSGSSGPSPYFVSSLISLVGSLTVNDNSYDTIIPTTILRAEGLTMEPITDSGEQGGIEG